jgi:hypothetical protein
MSDHVENVIHMLCEVASAVETASAANAAELAEKPQPEKELNKTELALVGMLRENTGCHILDSGGAYGRSWQRNQARAFWNEPATSLSFRAYTRKDETTGEIEVTHDVYHWLRERLDYAPLMDRYWRLFCAKEENRDKHWLELIEDFAKRLGEVTDCECTSPWGDGDPVVINTYNEENLLSQTLQFMCFSHDMGDFCILQIHGGCDVRGGYTRPQVFECNGNSECAMFEYARATIAPDWQEVKAKQEAEDKYWHDNPPLPGVPVERKREEYNEVCWDTDDGCHWYFQGSCGCGAGTQLEDFPAKEIETREEWEEGFLCIMEDGTGLCPITGCTLKAGAF